MPAHIEMILLFEYFLQITAKSLTFIIGYESDVDVAFAPFIFQSFRQVIPPLLYEDIIA
jgi:hypothetical protein